MLWLASCACIQISCDLAVEKLFLRAKAATAFSAS